MKCAAAFFPLLLSSVSALPASSLSNADWLSTKWDAIVVGESWLENPVSSLRGANETTISGAGPAGIIVAERMSEAGQKMYAHQMAGRPCHPKHLPANLDKSPSRTRRPILLYHRWPRTSRLARQHISLARRRPRLVQVNLHQPRPQPSLQFFSARLLFSLHNRRLHGDQRWTVLSTSILGFRYLLSAEMEVRGHVECDFEAPCEAAVYAGNFGE